jgi:hypothetical protein
MKRVSMKTVAREGNLLFCGYFNLFYLKIFRITGSYLLLRCNFAR